MRLKSIEIQGFKSFADKTVLQFGKGITGVVGPNGSGKSNISDAVRWVLGEQSTKNLRGQAMEDVIFNGTADRRPHGFAEVTLVIDNSDRTLDFDNDHVAITRRYYRSHESEYLINNAVVRLRDINELFMDTGLGRDGYSMIGQGKVDAIIGSKSDERRDIFEEASGISKYRYRKIDAERKLLAADENMLRLKDIMAELEGRVGPLFEQSEKAKKFLEYSEIKKDLELGIWLHSLEKSNDVIKEQEEKITVARAQYRDIENKLEEIVEEIEKGSEDYSATIVKIDDMRHEISAAEEAVARLDGDIALLNSEIDHNNESVERIKADIKELEESETKIHADITDKNAQVEAQREEISKMQQTAADVESELTGLISNSEGISRNIEELTKQLNTISAEISEHRVKMVTAESSVSEIEMRRKTIGEALKENAAELDAYGVENKELEEFLKKAEETITECQNSLKGYEMIAESRRQKVEELKEKLDSAHLDIEDKKRRVKILEELERNMEGFSFSVKAVMKEAETGLLKGVYGPVSSLIKVDKEYATAIETALGAAMQNVVVSTEADAKRAINFLKASNKGRATFLPVDTIKSKSLKEKGIDSCFGFVGIASELVKVDDKFRGIIENLLGKTVISEDIDTAVTTAKKFGYAFKVVTLDGQVVNAGGSLTGGSLSKNTGILSRAGDIQALYSKIESLMIKANLLTEQYNAANSDAAQIEANITNAKSELTTAQEDKIRILGEIKRIGDLVLGLNRAAENYNSELLLLDEREAELDKTVKESSHKIAENEIEKAKAQREIDALSGGRDSVTDKREALSQQLVDIRISIMKKEKDIEAILSSINLLEESISTGSDKSSVLNLEINGYIEKNLEITNQIETVKTNIEETRKQIEEKKNEINALVALRDNTDKNSQELRRKEREMTADREKVGGDLVRLEERKENLLKEYDDIIRKLFDEYELTRTEAEQIAKPVENVTESKKSLGEIKGKIKNLGSVNVAAIEEYKEVKERYDFMSVQIADVERSRQELGKLIDELTSQMKEKFQIGFEKISKNFSKVFTELFGGGSAELVMTDPDNVLESGIDIVAKLPGKNVPSLEGLSGGEKALVAISIYFAIMMVNPPPFCFLDEVDTALDDINVDRFATYMNRSDFNTQFICVTHRRGTMEAADLLYGVTMQEKGVTKLLELNVEELVKKLNIGEN